MDLDSAQHASVSEMSLRSQLELRALLAGIEEPKAIRPRRISVNDLDRRPSPLPNTDAWPARELDLPACAVNGHGRPGFRRARPVDAMRTEHIGEDSDRIVPFEGDEGGSFSQSLVEDRLDAHTE